MATQWQLPIELVSWITTLSQVLHARLAWRLLPLMTGMLFAQGRRTVASWLRGGGLGGDFQRYYYFLGSLGRNVKWVATPLLRLAIQVIQPGERLLVALDDTPTKRQGPKVEGAGIHHNPTPGRPSRAPTNQQELDLPKVGLGDGDKYHACHACHPALHLGGSGFPLAKKFQALRSRRSRIGSAIKVTTMQSRMAPPRPR